MKRMMFGLLVCFTFALAGCSSSSTSGGSSGTTGGGGSNADKIVGTWKITKIGDTVLPKNADAGTMEFTKDGKAKMSGKGKGTEEGTYKVEGDKLTLTKNDKKDKGDTTTIKTITADTLILVSGEDGMNIEIELKKQ
jgi:uncharacterized protein (TIGR03066 family)